jgi:glycosyltransferase involved in cell wall biosynthesis
MPQSPLVSVVITTYDRPELLPRAVKSVLNQTYDKIECIIVDDCSSSDQTPKVVASFNSSKVTYHRHVRNRGLSAARNTGIELSEGKYIAFLDDDDEWAPTKLQQQVSLFEQLDDDFGIVYCWMNYRSDDTGEVLEEYCPKNSGDIFPQTLDGQPIGAGSTFLVRQSVATAVGGFDETLPRGVDGDFVQRVCQEYKVDYVPELLVEYYVEHGHQRITRDDEDGLRNHINSLHNTIEKFGEELTAHPERAANIYGDLGHHYWELGDRYTGLCYYLRAIKTAPTAYTGYRWLLRRLVQQFPAPVVERLRRVRN